MVRWLSTHLIPTSFQLKNINNAVCDEYVNQIISMTLSFLIHTFSFRNSITFSQLLSLLVFTNCYPLATHSYLHARCVQKVRWF